LSKTLRWKPDTSKFCVEQIGWGSSRTDTPQTVSYVEGILKESSYAFLKYHDAILNAGSPRFLVEQFQRFVDRFVR